MTRLSFNGSEGWSVRDLVCWLPGMDGRPVQISLSKIYKPCELLRTL